jgi:hypothetical protein
MVTTATVSVATPPGGDTNEAIRARLDRSAGGPNTVRQNVNEAGKPIPVYADGAMGAATDGHWHHIAMTWNAWSPDFVCSVACDTGILP